MDVFDVNEEQQFDPTHHVERILSHWPGGDVSLACWEPGQISPDHCHPHATEVYFCFSGGGRMRTPDHEAPISPGSFVVHPPGEVHEYVNGPNRTLLFRVRVGDDMTSRHLANRGMEGWSQRPQDAAYFAANPPGAKASQSGFRPHGIVLMIAVIGSFYYGIRRSRRESMRLTAEGQ